MGWMPTDTATRYAMGLPTLTEQETAAERQSREEQERIRGRSHADSSIIQANASRFGSQTAADAAVEAARIRAGLPGGPRYGYAKGGPVVHVGYKHSNDPMYAKYSATMDSSLLAKNRKRT